MDRRWRVTDDHPAKAYVVERYATVRVRIADMPRDELGDDLPAGLTADGAASLLIALMDGLQLQWLLSPEDVDMPAFVSAFADKLRAR